MRTYPVRKLAALLYASTMLFAMPGASQAADIYYDGPIANSNWATAANWSTNTVPTATDTAVIGPGITSIIFTNGQTLNVGSINITQDATIANIGTIISTTVMRIHGVNGVGLRYSGGRASQSDGFRRIELANSVTFVVDNPVDGEFQIAAANGSVNIGAYDLTVDTVNSLNELTVTGAITGTGNLIKIGDGVLTMNPTAAPNTYTGYTDIQAGTVALRNSATLSTSSSINLNGTLDVTGVTATSTAVQTLTGDGEVILGDKTLEFTNARSTFGGEITGAGGISVTGGNFVLSGDNRYTGTTTIAAGTSLQIGAGGTTGSLASPQIANEGELSFNHSGPSVYDGTISGGGNLTVSAGALTLTGDNDYTGTTTIATNASLAVGATGSLASLQIANDGMLFFSPSDPDAYDGTISGSGHLVKQGAGSLTLSSAQSYIGYTDIQSGTLALAGSAKLNASSLINADGTLDISGVTPSSTGIQTLTGEGTVALGDKTLELTNASTAFAGTIEGTGGVTVSGGDFALAGNNIYTGTTTIAPASSLQIGAGGNDGTLASPQIVNDGKLSFDRLGALDIGGSISGNGDVYQSGPGTTALSGDNSYGGTTHVEAGTLQAGSATAFSTASSFTVSPGATLDLNDISQTIAGLTNAGNVRFGASTDAVLHITGDYAGNNGMLTINGVLGDDGSAVNRVVIDGSTSGTAMLHVNNLGGTGAYTSQGIEVITVGGNSLGAFTLDENYRSGGQPAIVLGAYEYTLSKGNLLGEKINDWFLVSVDNPPAPTPSSPGDQPQPEPSSPDSQPPSAQPEQQPQPKLQAGAPVYEAYSQHLLGMNSVSSLRQRVGNRFWAGQDNGRTSAGDATDAKGNGVWGRIEGAHNRFDPQDTSTKTSLRQNIFKMQAGIDGALAETEQGSFIGGVYGQYIHGKSRTSSDNFADGDIATDGYGLGGTLTWYGQDGFYADALAQATWYDSDLTTAAEHAPALAEGQHAFGYALSLETGKRFSIDDHWSVTPQGQLVYSSVDADDFTDAFGSAVQFDRGESLQGRLGLNLDYSSSWQNAQGTIDRTSLYGIANLYYEFRDGTRADLAGVSLANRQDRLWGGLGFGGSYNWDNERYSVFGEGLVNTSLNDFGDSYTLKGNAGFRVKW